MTQPIRVFETADSEFGARALLPATARVFLHNRFLEALGLLILIIVSALTIALFSYAPSDPSFNNSNSGATANYIGTLGAFAADLIIQSFGMAGYFPLLGFAIWGLRLITKRDVPSPFWRGFAMLLTPFAAAVSFSALPEPPGWPLTSGLGGVAGTIILERSAAIFQNAGIALAELYLAMSMALAASALWIFAIGLQKGELRAASRSLRFFGLALYFGVRKTSYALKLGSGCNGGKRDHSEQNQEIKANRELSANDTSLQEMAVRVSLEEGKTLNEVPEKHLIGLVAPRKPKPKAGRKATTETQGKLALDPEVGYSIPPLVLLKAPHETPDRLALNRDTVEQNAKFLGTVLQDFRVKGEIVKVRPGPVVTLYELEPAPGTKTSRVIGLSDDIARSMSAVAVRVAVVPGQNVIGIELPNINRELVLLRELLASRDFERSKASLPLAIGKDIGGAPVTTDLARMPHLLIAGTTGSGKSVAMNTMILSLLYSLTPDQCKLIMIDPKMLELSVYEGIPHLLTPVVTDPSKAVVALKWAVREMEDRYRAMSQLGVRNIAGFNARLKEAEKKDERLTRRVQTGFDDGGKPVFEDQLLPNDPLPFIVVVVDEMADLMLVSGKDVESAIQRLAQMARAAGIHLIMATQRPSVDVITGTVKANFPTRISFQVTSKIDSRTILGEQGAEQLLGQGDMLYMEGGGRITRIHSPFVSDNEVEEVVKYIKNQGKPQYIQSITSDDNEPDLLGSMGEKNADALYDEAVALVTREGKASTSFIQRHLQIGYNRAARIIEHMEQNGVVSAANRVGRREVLASSH